MGYDTEAFAIYDTMCYIKPPIHTICVGTAWGEAAMLLACGAKASLLPRHGPCCCVLAPAPPPFPLSLRAGRRRARRPFPPPRPGGRRSPQVALPLPTRPPARLLRAARALSQGHCAARPPDRPGAALM